MVRPRLIFRAAIVTVCLVGVFFFYRGTVSLLGVDNALATDQGDALGRTHPERYSEMRGFLRRGVEDIPYSLALELLGPTVMTTVLACCTWRGVGLSPLGTSSSLRELSRIAFWVVATGLWVLGTLSFLGTLAFLFVGLGHMQMDIRHAQREIEAGNFQVVTVATTEAMERTVSLYFVTFTCLATLTGVLAYCNTHKIRI